MKRLLHAMGDVHPHRLKAELARKLSEITFQRWTKGGTGAHGVGKTIFCNSGFEAVEAALKTARLATGKAGIIAFEGGYHGLGYGTLNATHRSHFRSPFRDQLRQFGSFVPFPSEAGSIEPVEKKIRGLLRKGKGAILVEPVQVRGGLNIPPPGFLPLLRRLATEHTALLILDEIYTGFGRTGRWFACEHSGVEPDLICLGKALTGGFPLSACVGAARVMDRAWPASTGEAIHTSTFLGHPVGCAMALANIRELERGRLVERSANLGKLLLRGLSEVAESAGQCSELAFQARGLGLLAGLEARTKKGMPATAATLTAIKALLHEGYIFLPEGEHANVISFSPPLTIEQSQLESAMKAVQMAMIGVVGE
jgi:acetylornithine/succinyldiaminopimelate/putrescine aminotransferase